jgi:hypothetical protein
LTGKDLSETTMLNLQGAINANSRKFIESWKSPLSNTKNPGNAKNSAKPKKPKQTQLRETCDSAKETRAKLDDLTNFIKQTCFFKPKRFLTLV